MSSKEHFIEGWNFIQTLGEGAYGEVKLAVNTKGEKVAVKTINLFPYSTKLVSDPNPGIHDIEMFIKKETAIHKALRCKNIIRFFGMRKEIDLMHVYIFLEYVSGGELFDRIEPDIGIPRPQARDYFTQLINGIDYIHEKGITHRDIKPENILFDSENVLKICDFGLATMFRFQGKERKLTRRCGTISYVAPEVMDPPYYAIPAELWSCGIVLFCMLFGQLPWDQPNPRDPYYDSWITGRGRYQENSPLNQIEKEEFSILQGLLAVSPQNRFTIENIRQHKWFTNQEINLSSVEPNPSNFHDTVSIVSACSQPSFGFVSIQSDGYSFQREAFFSQPINLDEVYLGTQFATQTHSADQNYDSLTKRLTRIFFQANMKSTINSLLKLLSKLGLAAKQNADHSNACIRVCAIDSKAQPLQFNLLVYCFEEATTMVEFRRTRGDALEFKRKFKLIEHALKSTMST